MKDETASPGCCLPITMIHFLGLGFDFLMAWSSFYFSTWGGYFFKAFTVEDTDTTPE